jgi:hypothetical protein
MARVTSLAGIQVSDIGTEDDRLRAAGVHFTSTAHRNPSATCERPTHAIQTATCSSFSMYPGDRLPGRSWGIDCGDT